MHTHLRDRPGTAPSDPSRLPVPGATTRFVAAQLAGPERAGEVVHAGRHAVYVRVGGACVAVLARGATQVPCGIRTALPTVAELPAFGSATVGGGVLRLGTTTVAVRPIVDASVPRVRASAATVRVLAAGLRGHPIAVSPAALSLLAAGDPRAVDRLLGLGDGLTPLGDDVLAGWLATARAVGHPARDRIAETVSAAADRTTTLSATLLACADRGETIPQLRRLLTLETSSDPVAPATTSDDAVGRALDDLLRVGHTSGLGLATGCVLALLGDGVPR